MEEIRYGEWREEADLAGRNVAEVRGLYEKRFGIPDGARAKLNDGGLKKAAEPETTLEDGDILCFAERSRVKQFLAVGLMASLALTGGLFAYAYTSGSTDITASSGGADFASVTVNNTMSSYTVFGKYKGAVGAGNLFNVTPASGFGGDIEVNIYFTNLDEMVKTYGVYLLRLEMANVGDESFGGGTKPLTLNNGMVTFLCDNLTGGTTYYVQVAGGVYRAFPWSIISGNIYGPDILCDVLQVGT